MTEKKMTEIEAAEMLKAYYVCQQMQVKGIYEKCNSNKCDDCDLCYKQGNNGERIESTKIAILALEKQIPKKPIRCQRSRMGNDYEDYYCACGNFIGYEPQITTMLNDGKIPVKYCDKCGQKLDWSGETVEKNVFCEHDYRILSDYQQTSAKSKKTTHYVIAKCIKCGKKQRFIDNGFGQTIGGVTDETY